MASLDSSFGNNGKVVTDLGSLEYGVGLAIQPDGKILVAGRGLNTVNGTYDFTLLRYNSNGVQDTSFNPVRTDFNSDYDLASSLALQSDGKILVAGQTFFSGTGFGDYDFALARYNSSGLLDTSFSGDGKTTTYFTSDDDVINVVNLQSDGKILVAGRVDNTFDDDFGLARYTDNGALDTSFNTTGKAVTDFGGDDEAYGLLFQPDGKAIVVGRTDLNGNQDFALARYDVNGNLDTSFGKGGKVITDFAGFNDEAYAATLQADGKILVVGETSTGTSTNFALARYNADGTLDTAFGTGGKVTTDFFGKLDGAASVHIQPNGKIVVTGSVGNNNSDFGIARYNTDGSLDTSFDADGKLVTDLGGDDVVAKAVLQDGKLTLVGSSFKNLNDDLVMARYVLNQKPTDLSLSSLTVAENQLIGTTVGTFSTTDPDVGDTFTYSLAAGTGSTDNNVFEIVGNTLKTKQAFDFETKSAYSIRVKTTDAYGSSIEKELKVAVSDIEDKIIPDKPKPEAEKLIPVKPKPKGDPIVGTRKNDRLVGTAEDDLIQGLKGNDKLVGRASNDILVGGADNDVLKGGAGDDLLRGGKGKDVCFLQNNGIDTIQGFSDSQDKLKLTGGLTFTDLIITQQGNDVLIGTSTSKFALLTGINVNQITAADFV